MSRNPQSSTRSEGSDLQIARVRGNGTRAILLTGLAVFAMVGAAILGRGSSTVPPPSAAATDVLPLPSSTPGVTPASPSPPERVAIDAPRAGAELFDPGWIRVAGTAPARLHWLNATVLLADDTRRESYVRVSGDGRFEGFVHLGYGVPESPVTVEVTDPRGEVAAAEVNIWLRAPEPFTIDYPTYPGLSVWGGQLTVRGHTNVPGEVFVSLSLGDGRQLASGSGPTSSGPGGELVYEVHLVLPFRLPREVAYLMASGTPGGGRPFAYMPIVLLPSDPLD